ncbi:MAG: hypothetical protein M1820_009914 [Bogoriella megaspora]|nr:MAG: hypothetical protein M1820_009914 [Bogoriella megaspora]
MSSLDPSGRGQQQAQFPTDTPSTATGNSNIASVLIPASAPGYTKLGPPRDTLRPIQPSSSGYPINPINLPPFTNTDSSLDLEEETAGQGVSGRQWEIAPRPRPGRKLATDAPDTKRKQQNRDAQRAFRERRAMRVKELEAELDQQKQTHSKELQAVYINLEREKEAYVKKFQEEFCESVESDKRELRAKDEELHRKDLEIAYWREKYKRAQALTAMCQMAGVC